MAQCQAEVENSIQESRNAEEKAKKALTDVSIISAEMVVGAETGGFQIQGAWQGGIISSEHSQSVAASWRDARKENHWRGKMGPDDWEGRLSMRHKMAALSVYSG